MPSSDLSCPGTSTYRSHVTPTTCGEACMSHGGRTETIFSIAAAELARRDPIMAKMMDRNGPFSLPRRYTRHFAALAESILYQQLAGAAASAIPPPFVGLFDCNLSP